MSNQFPPAIEKFISDEIDSLEQLEILLLLSSEAERWWTAAEVYGRIKSSPLSVNTWLDGYCERGLVTFRREEPTAYRFASGPPETLALVKALAQLYRERRFSVIERVFAKPLRPIRSFADAFKFKKGPDHG